MATEGTLMLSGVSVAASETASARLVYVRGPGAEDCPGEQAIRAAVGARLGYDPFLAWARDTMFVEIQRRRRSAISTETESWMSLSRGPRSTALACSSARVFARAM
jgi:hypothetical protein